MFFLEEVLRTEPAAQWYLRTIVKDWIESPAVNVLAHADAERPCFSIREADPADPRRNGRVLGLHGIDRPSYPKIPENVCLQAGKLESNQQKKEIPKLPGQESPPIPIAQFPSPVHIQDNSMQHVGVVSPAAFSSKTVPHVAVHGKDRFVDLACERDLSANLPQAHRVISEKPQHRHLQSHIPKAGPCILFKNHNILSTPIT